MYDVLLGTQYLQESEMIRKKIASIRAKKPPGYMDCSYNQRIAKLEAMMYELRVTGSELMRIPK